VDAEVAHTRHEDVDIAITVDVGHRDARLPADGIRHTGTGGNVLEAVVAFVQVEAIGADVGCEIEIRKPVVVDVPDRDAAAVVVVEIIENVERGVFRKTIRERDACAPRIETLEERSRW
jgi:hypothetical protein